MGSETSAKGECAERNDNFARNEFSVQLSESSEFPGNLSLDSGAVAGAHFQCWLSPWGVNLLETVLLAIYRLDFRY